ncbi:MAG TPA: PspC domain-containing protein, partial [Natronosporangium sp.]
MSEDRTRDSVPFAARHGLVRPLQGRYVAGVCAALAKATRTDPVLWRVGLAVLICFGGVGALIYLLTWLLTPEEGDTASPAEAMIGRGQSNTSPVLTGALGLIVAGLLIFVLSRPQYLVLGGAVVLAIALLINKVSNEPPPTGPPPGDPPAGGPTPPPTDAPPADAPPAGPVPADGLAATPTDRPPADAVPAATGGGDTVTEPVRAAAAEPAGASATDPANATEPAGATEPGTTLTEPWQQPTRPIPPASPLPSLQPPPF